MHGVGLITLIIQKEREKKESEPPPKVPPLFIGRDDHPLNRRADRKKGKKKRERKKEKEREEGRFTRAQFTAGRR